MPLSTICVLMATLSDMCTASKFSVCFVVANSILAICPIASDCPSHISLIALIRFESVTCESIA